MKIHCFPSGELHQPQQMVHQTLQFVVTVQSQRTNAQFKFVREPLQNLILLMHGKESITTGLN
uniref:Uncharacterized protein n=1 Tax=Rhizophora mucronata TaxID=61149 RepID=A0A2P2J790_RHIMU